VADSPAGAVMKEGPPADSGRHSEQSPRAAHDHRSRRCPMLGHPLTFAYCRAPGSSRPCRKILDCWWETFDVKAFLRSCYDDESLTDITAPPKQKMLSLVELIEQARRKKEE